MTTCVLSTTMFKIKHKSVAKLARMYLSKVAGSNNVGTQCIWPEELPVKTCGWGAESFQHKKKDEYCVVKEVHLKKVSSFVTDHNTSMKDMCSVNVIICHLHQQL